jgi:transketolase
MEPTRKGLGQALAQNGDDERVVCLGLDISSSITLSDFYAGKPERKKTLHQHGNRRAIRNRGGGRVGQRG